MVKEYEADIFIGFGLQMDRRFANENHKFEHLFGFDQETHHIIIKNPTEKMQRAQNGDMMAMMTSDQLSRLVNGRWF